MASNRRPVYGFGINDADYPTFVRTNPKDRSSGTTCVYYQRWIGMLRRCSDNFMEASYTGATVSDEFKSFMSFREWSISGGLTEKNKNILELDKDILIAGNKEYSPVACVYVPGYINRLILTADASRGECYLGVKRNQNGRRFMATYALNGKTKHIGIYDTQEEAHYMWQTTKSKYILEVIEKYKMDSKTLGFPYSSRVEDALVGRSLMLNNQASLGLITTTL